MTRQKIERCSGTCLAVKEHRACALPPMWRVVLLNDDYTTMDFVVFVLRKLFGKTCKEAEKLMLEVHQTGRGIAGVYVKDVAESLAARAMHLAKDNGFPFRCLVERQE